MDYITWMWWALSQSFSYTAAYYCRCIMLKMWNPLKNQNLNELAFMKCRSLGSWNSMQQEIVRWKFCPSIWTNRSMNASSKNYNKLCYQRNVTMAKKKTFPSSIASDGLTVSGLHHSRTETSLLQWWQNCYHTQCTVANELDKSPGNPRLTLVQIIPKTWP